MFISTASESNGVPIGRFIAVVVEVPDAQPEFVHSQTLDVGRSAEKIRLHEFASVVGELLETGTSELNARPRSSLLSGQLFLKLTSSSAFRRQSNAHKGGQELDAVHRSNGFTATDEGQSRCDRINEICHLQQLRRLDDNLCWAVKSAETI